jgi:ParB/RepB/Spo0J family partition protein
MTDKNKPKKQASFDIDYNTVKDDSLPKTKRNTTPVANILKSPGSDMSKDERREKVIIQVDARKTEMWKYADRTETDEELDISDLLISMAIGKKQMLPALARKIDGDDGIKYEIIYGRRRRELCLRLGRPLEIELTTESDKDCARYMKIENYDRKDITIMQRAHSYYNQFVKGEIYGTMREMSENLGEPEKTLQRHIKAGALWFNENLLGLGVAVKDIGLMDAYKISSYSETSPSEFDDIINRLKGENLSGAQVIKRILAVVGASTQKEFFKTYKTSHGNLAAKTLAKGKEISLKIPMGLFMLEDSEDLINEINKIRQDMN